MSSSVDERLRRIEERLDALEIKVRGEGRRIDISSSTPVSVSDLLALPDSLRKTMLVVQDIGEGTANDVAKESGRTRNVETIYLNQLVRMGYLTRERKGRKIFFKQIKYY